MPVGYAVAGPAADALGVGEALTLAGCIQLTAVAAILLVGDVRNLRRTDEADSATVLATPA